MYDKSYNKEIKTGGKNALNILLLIVAAVVGLSIFGYVFGWFSEGAQVAKEEFGARASLKKYEWFINKANQINKMDRDILIFTSKVKSVEKRYEAFGAKENWSIATTTLYTKEISTANDDLVAVTSQRNNLAKEYNSQSEKFNWNLYNTRDDKPSETYTLIE